MAIPNGVRPQKAEPTGAMADDSASEADSAGWETASDVDSDSVSAQPSKATPSSGGKMAEATSRLDSGTTATTSGSQSMDTSATDRAVASSATGTSADEASSAQQFEEWDVCRSLFDNHVSASMEANLEYMLKHFGFYLPDTEYLSDPAGLIKYLVRAHCTLHYTHVILSSAFTSASSSCHCLHISSHNSRIGQHSTCVYAFIQEVSPFYCLSCAQKFVWLYPECSPTSRFGPENCRYISVRRTACLTSFKSVCHSVPAAQMCFGFYCRV